MDITYRTNLVIGDREEIGMILESTGVFYDFEIGVALEIVDDFIKDGVRSEYLFIAAEYNGKLIGYVNFGPSPCTRGSWDIYWIAVKKEFMNWGLGKILLKMAEDKIRADKGVNIWVETSSRKEYEATRSFYQKRGYDVASELTDFYSRGDNKVIFHKLIPENYYFMADKPGEDIIHGIA